MTAVIVLNWNDREQTCACLATVEAIRDEWWRCYVVDNASTDGSQEAVRSRFPWARLIQAPSNLGYAGGNNLGLRAALDDGAEAVFVLNNDTTIAPGTLGDLRSSLTDPSVGLSGAIIYRSDGDGGFWYAGGEISRRPYAAQELRDASVADAEGPTEVGYVPGCALTARRDVLERIGLFDERFFFSWEDSDLSARSAEAGFRNIVVPRTKVCHEGSRAFEGTFSPAYSYYYFRNMLLYARLHFPPAERPRAYRDTVRFARRVYRRRRRQGSRDLLPALLLAFGHFAIGRYGIAPRRLIETLSRGRQ